MGGCAEALGKAAQFCVVKALSGEVDDVLCALDIINGATLREVSLRYGLSYRRVKSILKSVVAHAESAAECGRGLAEVLEAAAAVVRARFPRATRGVCAVCDEAPPPGSLPRHIYLAHGDAVLQLTGEVLAALGVQAEWQKRPSYGGGWWFDKRHVEPLLPAVERAVASVLGAVESRWVTLRVRAVSREVRRVDRSRVVAEASAQRVAVAVRWFFHAMREVRDARSRVWVKVGESPLGDAVVLRLLVGPPGRQP